MAIDYSYGYPTESGGGSIPLNFGSATLKNVPYLQQQEANLKYTPEMTNMMQQMYGVGAKGLASLASSPLMSYDAAMYGKDMPYEQLAEYMPELARVSTSSNITKNLPSANEYFNQNYSTPQLGSLNLPSIENYNFSNLDFAPIEKQAMAQFEQSMIPSIAERFTGMGAGASGSSAMARSMAGAGVNLQQALAAQKAQMATQWDQMRSQYGLQRQSQLQQNAALKQQQQAAQAGLQQNYDTLNASRSQAAANYALQQGQMSLAELQNQQNFALQKQQAAQQAQQQRTAQLLGLLGFSPPQTWGSPVAKTVTNPYSQEASAISGTGLSTMSNSLTPDQQNLLPSLTPAQAATALTGLGYKIPQQFLGGLSGTI